MRVQLAAILLTALVAGCISSTTTGGLDVDFADGFEAGLSEWAPRSDLPEDPNRPGQRVNWTIQTDDARTRNGTAALNFTLDGRQDDGTIWVVRAFPVASGRTYTVSASVWFFSESESFNTIAHVVLSVSDHEPTGEGSFPSPGADPDGPALREPLNQAAGWVEYRVAGTVADADDGVVHVAFGISAVWETEMTYYADDVVVTLRPVER